MALRVDILFRYSTDIRDIGGFFRIVTSSLTSLIAGIKSFPQKKNKQ